MADLEKRIETLEKKLKSRWLFFMQYLVFPALLLVGGYFFNSQFEEARQELTRDVEAAKQSFQMLELEVRRIEAAQKFLQELFSGSVERAMLSEKLMSRILADDKLANEISKTVEEYYKNEISEALRKENIEKASKIQTAAAKIRSPAGQSILNDEYFVIIASVKDREAAIKQAKKLKESGFNAEVIKSVTGYYGVALGRFNFEDAKSERKLAIQRGYPKDSYLMTRDRVIENVYPK